MIGAIAGDIIGSVYEWNSIKKKNFPLFSWGCKFTDDSVLSIAVAAAILQNKPYKESISKWGRKYPNAGYGGSFSRWLMSSDPQPYNSWGNGSAMRVSPVGFAFNTEEKVLEEAKKSAEITHNHPEGIKGAQATALSVFLARSGNSKDEIRAAVQSRFGYSLDRGTAEIRPGYSFDVSCQGSVPEAIIAFLDSTDWEDAVRNAVSLGGDSDTQACIAGAIAEAFYKGVPEKISKTAKSYLSTELEDVLMSFEEKYS
ncbi:MAG: ADP-ribosylglycohydrolase family protein [Spirochaetia bacterium]